MQPSRHKVQATFARAARVVAALALVLALLSGIAPAGSLASASSASECSMSCCIGLPPHKAGECAGVSCHVALAQNASHDKHGKVHDTHDDRHNTAAAHETAAHHQHESQAQPTATHNEASHHAHAEEAHHAEARQASESSATTDAEHASSKSKRERRPNVAPASLANPCPSDCGMAAGNARNNVRPRDAATLTAAHRPRPHARLADSKHSSNLPLASAGKRRLAPPRAPPLAL